MRKLRLPTRPPVDEKAAIDAVMQEIAASMVMMSDDELERFQKVIDAERARRQTLKGENKQ